MNDVNVGEWLAHHRKALGWSQSTLQYEARVSDRQISFYETGRNLPDVKTLEKLVRAMAKGGANITLPWWNMAGEAGSKTLSSESGDMGREHKPDPTTRTRLRQRQAA